MSRYRSKVIRNDHLHYLTLASRLHHFFRSPCNLTSLTFSNWQPSGRKKAAPVPMNGKTVADIAESLCGAFLVSRGEAAARLALQWIGIPVLNIHVQIAPVPFYNRMFLPQPENKPRLERNTLDSMDVNLVDFQSNYLKYTFHNTELLYTALLVNRSDDGNGNIPPRTFQRLEFLGDAILDYLVMSLGFEKDSKWTPAHLSKWKSTMVKNATLSQVAALHFKVHQFTSISIEETTQEEEEEDNKKKIVYSKRYADIYEALVGAIFLDSDYNLFTVRDIMLSPLRTYCEQHAIGEAASSSTATFETIYID